MAQGGDVRHIRLRMRPLRKTLFWHDTEYKGVLKRRLACADLTHIYIH
jgi:hypothetical protein